MSAPTLPAVLGHEVTDEELETLILHIKYNIMVLKLQGKQKEANKFKNTLKRIKIVPPYTFSVTKAKVRRAALSPEEKQKMFLALQDLSKSMVQSNNYDI